jgi:hypothetical protein
MSRLQSELHKYSNRQERQLQHFRDMQLRRCRLHASSLPQRQRHQHMHRGCNYPNFCNPAASAACNSTYGGTGGTGGSTLLMDATSAA